MVSTRIQYEWSDAWLLLAIIYASKSGDSTIQKIIEVGDGINHAVFTDEELKGGIERLSQGGFVIERDGSFAPARTVIKAYYRKTTPRRAINNELKDIESFLGVSR